MITSEGRTYSLNQNIALGNIAVLPTENVMLLSLHAQLQSNYGISTTGCLTPTSSL